MSARSPWSRPRWNSAAAVLAATLLLVVLPQRNDAQSAKKPLSRDEIVELLESGVSPARVEEKYVRQYGVSFELTRENEAALRDAGATDQLLKAIRENARGATTPPRTSTTTTIQPPASTPPSLAIEVTPGGAQVYVDDEPIGTTSSSGRLKLTRISAGEHRVRLSLPGYADYEKTVELSPGQNTFMASLQPAPTHGTTQAAETGGGSTRTSSGQRGYLGVDISQERPQSTQGVLVSGAEPGGPADRAGIKTYDVIQKIDGRPVSTPQELVNTLSSHQAGDVVTITLYDGSKIVTKRVQLSASQPGESASTQGTQTQQTTPPVSNVTPIRPSLPTGAGFMTSPVMHDHGSAGRDYCVGVMGVGNGVIQYRSTNGIHGFDIPLNTVKEAKRNGLYLVALGAFHIRLKSGTVYNFVAINIYGQYQPPDPILNAINLGIK